MSKNYLEILYSYVFPSIVVFLLLGVSQFITRSSLLGSAAVDLSIRVLICLWFALGYRRFAHISMHRPTVVSSWSKVDLDTFEKTFYIYMGIIFGILMALFTWWVIQVFLPIFIQISILLAILNGLIFALPAVANYNVFKP